jgi:hypothetical protein
MTELLNYKKMYNFKFSNSEIPLEKYFTLFNENTNKQRGVTYEIMKKKILENLDPNIILLHGKINLNTFIEIPENFYIVTFISDNFPIIAETFLSESGDALPKKFSYYFTSMWMLYFYKILSENEDELFKNIQHYDKIKNDFLSRVFKEYHKNTIPLNKNFIAGRVSGYYINKPGDIISDQYYTGHLEDIPNNFIVGISDIFSYYEAEIKNQKSFDFAQENSIYKNIKSDLNATNAYPIYNFNKRGLDKRLSLSQIISYMQKKKTESNDNKPTILFLVSCRDIDNKVNELFSVKPNKRFMYNNLLQYFSYKMEELKRRNMYFDFEHFLTEKEKYIQFILYPKLYRKDYDILKKNINDIIFGTHSPFCMGVFSSSENIMRNSVFLYYEDFSTPYQVYKNNLLGIHWPFRDINGMFFKKSEIINIHNNYNFYLPANISGLIILNYMNITKYPFSRTLFYEFIYGQIFGNNIQLSYDMTIKWLENCKEYFLDSIYHRLLDGIQEYYESHSYNILLDIYETFILYYPEKSLIEKLIKAEYVDDYIKFYHEFDSFHFVSKNVGIDVNGRKFFPYLSFIEFFLANFNYMYDNEIIYFNSIVETFNSRVQNKDIFIYSLHYIAEFVNNELIKKANFNFIGNFKLYRRIFTPENVMFMLDNLSKITKGKYLSVDQLYYSQSFELLHRLLLKNTIETPGTFHGFDVILASYLINYKFDTFVKTSVNTKYNMYELPYNFIYKYKSKYDIPKNLDEKQQQTVKLQKNKFNSAFNLSSFNLSTLNFPQLSVTQNENNNRILEIIKKNSILNKNLQEYARIKKEINIIRKQYGQYFNQIQKTIFNLQLRQLNEQKKKIKKKIIQKLDRLQS